MEPEIEGRLVSDHRILSHRLYKQIGITFVGLCFLIGAVYAGYMYYAGPSIREAQLEDALENKIAQLDANPLPFEYTIVPNAQEIIKLPELQQFSTEELTSEFEKNSNQINQNEGEMPSIYNIPVGEITYLEYINNLPLAEQEIVFQMHDEIRTLTKELGLQQQQVSLAERVGQPEKVAYKDNLHSISNTPLVYPSLRVVEAAFIGQLLSRQFPSQATFYKDYTGAYIKEGVRYGYYTLLEAEIAVLVADDYINLAIKNDKAAKIFDSLE